MSTGSRWSVVIPAYNEQDFLPATLASLLDQSVADATIILVDNRSTDNTRALMEQAVRDNPGRDIQIISEERPGRTQAVQAGTNAATTEFVATCDADTIYPHDYLEKAQDLLDRGEHVAAAFAFGIYADASPFARWFTKAKGSFVAFIWRDQGHTGAYGQTFRTKALKAAGGFDPDVWPYTLEDHEAAHRVAKQGRILYRFDHCCTTSTRRKDRDTRGAIDWTLLERLMYNFMPAFGRDWFFYKFLGPRMNQRNLMNANLRERPWDKKPAE